MEVPQRDGGARPFERALPVRSRVRGGVEVLRAFVAEAQARTTGRPKIAVVTASGFDPMDAVDFYVDVFRELRADAVWWQVDGAAAAARFESGDCAARPRLPRWRGGRVRADARPRRRQQQQQRERGRQQALRCE